jgi:hypothetical protein
VRLHVPYTLCDFSPAELVELNQGPYTKAWERRGLEGAAACALHPFLEAYPLGRLPQVGDAHVAPQRGAELREALRSARLGGRA